MTALAMDVRELGFDEIDEVSGGSRRAVARWIIRRAEMAADQLENLMEDWFGDEE